LLVEDHEQEIIRVSPHIYIAKVSWITNRSTASSHRCDGDAGHSATLCLKERTIGQDCWPATALQGAQYAKPRF
jgi:hypothetical protein